MPIVFALTDSDRAVNHRSLPWILHMFGLRRFSICDLRRPVSLEGTIGLAISAMPPDFDEPLAVLHRYYHVFSTLNPDAVLPFYHEPCMFISAQGVNPVPVHAGLRAMVFVPIMEDLRARGFARSEFSLNYGQRLSDTLAIFIGTAVRYKAEGTELERVGITYILRKQNTDWKIAVLTVHNTV